MNLECRGTTLQIAAKLLNNCDSPIWLVCNEKLVSQLEYLLWDALREGISQHLSGSAPCILYDLDRMLTLIRKALGNLHFDRYQYQTKVRHEDIEISIFNDGNEDKPSFRREHLIHVQAVGVFGCTEGFFNAEQRNWNGGGDICFKSKKRMSYAGRDIGKTRFSEEVVDVGNKLFKGMGSLPKEPPAADSKLVPMNRTNRTIIG